MRDMLPFSLTSLILLCLKEIRENARQSSLRHVAIKFSVGLYEDKEMADFLHSRLDEVFEFKARVMLREMKETKI